MLRRKAIYEELHGKNHGGDRRSENARENQNENSAFCSATAEATGKDRRSVERGNARGEALGDDLAAVTGTSLDKGVELDALAKMPKDERKGLIDRAKAGERVTARKERKVVYVNRNFCRYCSISESETFPMPAMRNISALLIFSNSSG
jgi:hypothetical protein